jgi:hypothetical protein
LNDSPAYRNVRAWGETTHHLTQKVQAQIAAEDVRKGRPVVVRKNKDEILKSAHKKLRRAMMKIKLANAFSHVEFRVVKGEARDYAMRDIDNLVMCVLMFFIDAHILHLQ